MTNCSKCGSPTERRVLFQTSFYDHCFNCDGGKQKAESISEPNASSLRPSWIPDWFIEGVKWKHKSDLIHTYEVVDFDLDSFRYRVDSNKRVWWALYETLQRWMPDITKA